MKKRKLNAIVGVPKAFKIMESVNSPKKHWDIHMIISDGKHDYAVVVITSKKDLEMWEKFLRDLTAILKEDVSYIG